MISHEAQVCRLCRARHKRYAFATHAVHVEKIPVDIVGEWLKQRNLDVADYYSQPTEGMGADAADRYLARIAAHVHVGEAVRRSPTELRELYETARGKVGTLADVIGGHCVSPVSAPPTSPASAVPARRPIRPSVSRSNGTAPGLRPK
jgi:hypothetical protein